MLKILNTSQIREWDSFTIKNEPISSIDLMERACKAFVQWFTERFDTSKNVGIVCGSGNNGGDGLGIARLLTGLGYSVKVWVVKGSAAASPDFTVNFRRLPQNVVCADVSTPIDDRIFDGNDVLIDGLFGSGLSRPAAGLYKAVINTMNSTNAVRVAIDIPSGLFADKETEGCIVKADYTVTFQLPKTSFLIPESGRYVGAWFKVDIGLKNEYLSSVDSNAFWVTRDAISKRIKKRNLFAHKGDFGKALLIAGSYGKMGACVLAARAAMRSGLGLLTVHIPKVGYSILQIAVPEAMASVDQENEIFSNIEELDNFSSIGIGPGIGQDEKTTRALANVLEKVDRPMVIDADALNLLAVNRELLHLVPEGSVLTPHSIELERLVGSCKNGFERIEKAKSLAAQLKSFVVLKGAYTVTISPQGVVYFNSTGNSGMATGGSGDVLTGIITSLLAQSYPSQDAALLGVYIHGLAGDLASHEKGQQALIASDIIDFLPQAFKKLSD